MAMLQAQAPQDRQATDRTWMGVAVLMLLALGGMAWLGVHSPAEPRWDQAKQEAQEMLRQQQQVSRAAHQKQMEQARQALMEAKVSGVHLDLAMAKLDSMDEESVRLFIVRQQLARAQEEVAEARSRAESAAAWPKMEQAQDELKKLLAQRAQRMEAERRAALQPARKGELWLLIGVSVVAVLLMTRPAELRHLRGIQLILIPSLLVAMRYLLRPAHEVVPAQAMNTVAFLVYLPMVGVFAALLGANIAYFFARMAEGVLDPHDWTPMEEELALAPVRRLVQEDRCQEALQELERLLTGHKPSYEALLLKAKLLNHFQQVQPARQALLKMLRLTRNEPQQALVMQALRELAGAAKP